MSEAKRLVARILVAVGLSTLVLSGCSRTAQWKEEVRLSDGRTVEIEQKRRYEDLDHSPVRESWMFIKLPEFSNDTIIWNEKLSPLVLNVHAGKLYAVGIPPTGLEFRLYGKPQPAYVGFKYESGKWGRIPFEEIPSEIYVTNLLITDAPPPATKMIGVQAKREEQESASISPFQKQIDPKFSSNFH